MDVLAFVLIVVVAIAVALGSKFSANVNTAFVLLNVVVLFEQHSSAKGNISGSDYCYRLWLHLCRFLPLVWKIREWDLKVSHSFNFKKFWPFSFFPYGFGGTLTGAATCFFSFIGFEALGSAGEEAKSSYLLSLFLKTVSDPRKTIPLAIFGSLGLVTTLYVLMGAILSLLVPYDQVVLVFSSLKIKRASD